MRKIKLLTCLIALSIGIKAQDSIAFVRNSYEVNNLDTTASFTIKDSLYNAGLTTINSTTITFGCRVNNTVITAPEFIADTIPPTDTILPGINNYKLITFSIHNSRDTAPGFVIGTNAVVIWPIINYGAIHISPSDSIYITASSYPLGLKESPLSKIYIFETNNSLYIRLGDAENLVQQVRIYDLLGRSIYTGSAENSKYIPTPGWAKGLYLCQITTFNNETRTVKFRLE